MSLFESERLRELLAFAGLGGLSGRALTGVVMAALLLVGIGVWRFWPSAPAPEVTFDDGASTGASGEVQAADNGSGASAEATDSVVVHVAGAVMRPGVYRLPLGGRVTDAVTAAGGLLGTAAPDAVNLARILVDGEQIYLPTRDEVEDGSVGGSSGAGGALGATASGLVNINTANVSELDTLPGVGPATAQKIIEDREANGPFKKPEDLMRVPGIGQSKYDAIKDLVTTG